MQQLKDLFIEVLKQGEPELSKARELAERFLKQVHYQGLSLADQQRLYVAAFHDGDRHTLHELAQFAGDEQVREFARDALGLKPEKPMRLETKPIRSVFGNIDSTRTI